MKKLIASLILLASAGVQAADLAPQTCQYLSPTSGTCWNPTYLAFNSQVSILVYNGVSYTGPGFPDGNPHIYADAVFYADDGSSVVVNATLSYHSKYINSGRAHYYKHWWTLDGGSVQ